MNVFFIYFFAFFVNIHFYQALFIKHRSVENLNLFSQSDLFSWIFEYWIFECMFLCCQDIVLERLPSMDSYTLLPFYKQDAD